MSLPHFTRSTRTLLIKLPIKFNYLSSRWTSEVSNIQITPIQRILLAFGSSAVALVDPFRDDMVAVSGEVMGQRSLKLMLKRMSSDAEGSQILADRCRINSKQIDLKHLESLPINTLGHQYIKFLKDNNISCDTRKEVKFIDDPDLAYVMQRYRETHDLVHLLLHMPTNMLGEVVVKWIEAIQYDLPMCWGAAVFGAYRLKPKQRAKYLDTHLDWAIKAGKQSKYLINVYFEKRWTQDIDDLRQELNIPPPPS
ncbi:ubiquinone biosynthesis protein COQ4 homolog, mitochondrial-like [Panonychus citri]|uniref:ubiquinone biosynthesis protein COQ4 homolog, mitochondrial-like n=1 Tax=Panonychus citri TaxID=50023 RepID=UPI00230738AC|nr:ubiquinone biosynthesis protein COQ4 homolog, mitochondrial-like [Panonychus citri]